MYLPPLDPSLSHPWIAARIGTCNRGIPASSGGQMLQSMFRLSSDVTPLSCVHKASDAGRETQRTAPHPGARSSSTEQLPVA